MHDVKRDMVVSRIALREQVRASETKTRNNVQERNTVDRNRKLLLILSNRPIPGEYYSPDSGHLCNPGGCAENIVSYRVEYVLYNADWGYLRGGVEGGFFSISHVPGLDLK